VARGRKSVAPFSADRPNWAADPNGQGMVRLERVLLHSSIHMAAERSSMRTNIEIDDTLMAEAQRASGQATKKQTVEQALRLMIRLRRQQEVDGAFGKYRWRGNLARSRKGRGTG
jgi:Arc/MetJ family transcription regulator